MEPNRLVMAVLGVPNAGVTTTVNALARQNIPTSNVPFSTVVSAPYGVSEEDARAVQLAAKLDYCAIPANLTFLDTPGVGEQDFWTKTQWADTVLVVCRAFEQNDVVHLEDTVDPVRDLEMLWAAIVEKDLAHVEGIGGKKKKDAFTQEVLEKLAVLLKSGEPVRSAKWTTREEDVIIPLKLVSAKPLVYLINLTEEDFARQKNKWLPKVAKWVKEHDPEAQVVPYSASVEEYLAGLDEAAVQAHIEQIGAKKSMRARILEAGYAAAQVTRFYTVTNDVRVWAVSSGTRAKSAAACIHSDFEHGLQTVEVAAFDEYMGETKLHQKGKDYVVLDGDIIHFKVKPGGSPSNKCSSPQNKGKSPLSKGKSPSKQGRSPPSKDAPNHLFEAH